MMEMRRKERDERRRQEELLLLAQQQTGQQNNIIQLAAHRLGSSVLSCMRTLCCIVYIKPDT